MHEVKLVPTTTFSIDGLPELNSLIVERLRTPILATGKWHNLITPDFMYGSVNDKIFDGGDMQAEFRQRYQDKVAELGPSIRSPYTRLDSNWVPQPMVDDPKVKGAIEKAVESLPETIGLIEKHPEGSSRKALIGYLEKIYDLLPKGEFDQLMIEFLRLPPEEDIRFHALPVETRDDPMGDRATPQGFLAVVDREMTDRANVDMERYKRSAIHHFGKAPFKAWVFVANTAATSGALALANAPKSAFNIPNYQWVAEEAGQNGIYQMDNSIEQLNSTVLAPALLHTIGVESSKQDIIGYTTGHEDRHGEREDDNNVDNSVNLGWMRTAVREGWAAAGAVVTTDFKEFSTEELESVIRGMLSFANDDSAPFRGQLFNGYGINQPTLDDLLAHSGYAVEGYISLRKAYLDKAIRYKFGKINYDIIVQQAYDREKFYRKLAQSGNPDLAYRELSNYFLEEVQERRSWSFSSFWESTQRLMGRKDGTIDRRVA